MNLTWLEISKNALLNNILEIKKRIPKKTKFIAVVKSNAYGHGLLEVVKAVIKNVDYFAVYSFDDALLLRAKKITKPILMLGRVIDFGVIREVLGGWIDDNFDHNTILSIKDKKLGEKIAEITGQKIYYMAQNPTAENIARYIFSEICPKLFADKNVKCVAIKLYETPNCYANVE